MSKLSLSWSEYERSSKEMCRSIRNNLQDMQNVELVCISRGGLFVGGYVSYYLGIKIVHCVCLESYSDIDNTQKTVSNLTPFLPNASREKLYLFVDDVNDTSETFKYIKDQCNTRSLDFRFATVFHKNKNNIKPDYIGNEIDGNLWLEFPWDGVEDGF